MGEGVAVGEGRGVGAAAVTVAAVEMRSSRASAVASTAATTAAAVAYASGSPLEHAGTRADTKRRPMMNLIHTVRPCANAAAPLSNSATT